MSTILAALPQVLTVLLLREFGAIIAAIAATNLLATVFANKLIQKVYFSRSRGWFAAG